MPHVTDLLADLVPGFRNLLLRGVVLEQNGDQGLAGARLRAQYVDPGDFLQALFDPFGDLQLHFVRSSARPQCTHHHRLEGEVRILGAAELEIRKHTTEHQHDDQIGNQRAVAKRPFGQIGRSHRPEVPCRSFSGRVSSNRGACSMTWTCSPLLSLWTPATTILSPVCTPLSSTAVSSR